MKTLRFSAIRQYKVRITLIFPLAAVATFASGKINQILRCHRLHVRRDANLKKNPGDRQFYRVLTLKDVVQSRDQPIKSQKCIKYPKFSLQSAKNRLEYKMGLENVF